MRDLMSACFNSVDIVRIDFTSTSGIWLPDGPCNLIANNLPSIVPMRKTKYSFLL